MATETVLDDGGFDEWARAAVFSGLITFREPAVPPCIMFVGSSTENKAGPRGIINAEGVSQVSQATQASNPEPEKDHSAGDNARDESRDCTMRKSCEGDGHNDFHTWASEAVFLRLSSLSRTTTSNVVDDEDCNGDECSSRKECFNTWASERVFSCLP
ncbi:hypothetical protein THAOC_27051, partial [Thalassiosira oceanica]